MHDLDRSGPPHRPRPIPEGRRDVLVIGGGHNGLTCAAYLAAAGLAVTVLERRPVLGGAAVTEEFHPGFRNSVGAYTVSLLHPQVIADLGLARHGLRIIARTLSNFLPTADGGYLLIGPGRTAAEVARFSRRDAERLPAYEARMEAIATLLRGLMLETPPNAVEGGWAAALPQMLRLARLAGRVRRLDMRTWRDLLRLFGGSAGDWLDQWFESEPVKAAFGFDGIVGTYAGPYAAGSGYVLLHHALGEVNGQRGIWGHAVGGMGAISGAIAAVARERGVEIRTNCEVGRVLVENGRAVGVVTAGGDVLRASAVVANVDPRRLYLQLIEPAALPEELRAEFARYRCGSGVFRMNVALAELPDFTCLPGPGEHLTAGIVLAPTLRYMERAWADARETGWSREPIVEILIPSTVDPTLAPPGRHVASLFCQHVAPQLPDGSSWDAHRESVADLMIDTVTRWAPNFRRAVLARQVLSPLDLERLFGLTAGDIFHGVLGLDQMFAARPVLGHADYRAPIDGLYMCGAGTHPGGGVSGVPGHNAARELLADFRRRRLRRRS